LRSYPLFTGSVLPFQPVESAAARYAEQWNGVISEEAARGVGALAANAMAEAAEDIGAPRRDS
jgi:hypothetical protein